MRWFLFGCALLCMAGVVQMGVVNCRPGSNSLSCKDEAEIEPQFGPECLMGTSWQSRCNKCHCTMKGRKMCTQNICNSLDEEMHCMPGSLWSNQCNQCWCSLDGKPTCTLLQCGPLPYKDIPVQVNYFEESTRRQEKPAETVETYSEEKSATEKKPVTRSTSKRVVSPIAPFIKCGASGMSCIYGEKSGLRIKPIPTSSQIDSNKCRKNGEGCLNEEEMEPEFGPECLAGSIWYSQCNECHCTLKGKKVCTKNVCETADTEEERHCSVGSLWGNKCNKCWCREDGKPVCTMLKCDPLQPLDITDKLEIVTLATEKHAATTTTVGPLHARHQTINENTAVVTTNECAKGTKWRSKCNDCTCDESGQARCTIRRCSSQYDLDHDKRCAPSSLWHNECNSCWCNDGTPLCVKIGCTPSHSVTEVEKASSHPIRRSFKFVPGFNNEEPTTAALKVATPRKDKGVTTELDKMLCRPNQAFKNQCDVYCKCSGDGLSFYCASNDCLEEMDQESDVEVFMPNEGMDHIERHTVCEANSTFYISCNLCVCNVDGSDYSCADETCPLPKDVELFVETMEVRVIKRPCQPDEVFELDCNTCHCNSDGTTFSCTRHACFVHFINNTSSIHTRQVRATLPQETPKTCVPGKEFRLDCNTCLCDNEGKQFSCTRIDCNSNNKPSRRKREIARKLVKQCVPGAVFEEGCNACRCADDGQHAHCTDKVCNTKTTEDEKHDNDISDADKNYRCNPGERYKQDCNDCSCSADGKSFFCTIHLCGFYPS